ncbi:MAG TPA: CBS domain-containing protein [Acidobacteriota bacterium]
MQSEVKTMSNVREILLEKGNAVWTISPDRSVFDALQLMADKNIGALIVTDQEKVIGIFSERDYARKIILKGKASKETSVSEIMTPVVVYVTLKETVEDCMNLMTDKRIRHLPVIEEEKLVGLISIGDVVKAIISDREFTIKQLENYITGGPS